MLVRWYHVGAFSPFFRAHAHIDTKRREPFLLDEPYKSIVRDILKLRYSMLPVWYTAFRESSVTGMPVLRCEISIPNSCLRYSLISSTQAAIRCLPSTRSWLLPRRTVLCWKFRIARETRYREGRHGIVDFPRREPSSS